MTTKHAATTSTPRPVANMTLEALRTEAADCTACPLYKHATQTVFGEGPEDARLMLVGEQPGNDEDLQGAPFVGPAGKVLDRALVDAAIERNRVYVTNAVKHFKWEPRGKRRIHKTPAQQEVDACRQWLDGEIAAVAPRVIVCLGATAAKSLLGAKFKLTQSRGRLIEVDGRPDIIATFHPSYLLRLRDDESYQQVYGQLVEDLRAAGAAAARVLHR